MSGTLAAAIQNAVQQGAAIAASVMGNAYQQYRPVGVSNPTAPSCFVQDLPALFTADKTGKSVTPAATGKADWWAFVNISQLNPGDYLVGQNYTFPGDIDTWFCTSIFPDQSLPGFIRCTNLFSILRPAGNSSFGSQPYGGDGVSEEVPILTGWPGALVQGTKGEKGDSTLPGDVRMPWYTIFLPSVTVGGDVAAAGAVVPIMAADVVDDDFGRRYKVSSCELTNAGWRLTAILAQT